jgi:hypothetical protein
MQRAGWALVLCGMAACQEKQAAPPPASSGPGYWFHLFFIVLPLLVVMVKLFMDLSAVRESLYALESQFRRLNSRLDELEEKLKPRQTKPRDKADSKKEE